MIFAAEMVGRYRGRVYTRGRAGKSVAYSRAEGCLPVSGHQPKQYGLNVAAVFAFRES